jgi:hypothetical protein
MNLREFFSDPAIQLPLRGDTDDFQGFIEGMLDTYLAKLATLKEPADIVTEVNAQRPQITAFCTAGKDAVRAMLSGHPAHAYSLFVAGLSQLLPYLDRQALKDLKAQDLWMMYRVRQDSAASLTREALFHIPFELRHRVRTQRYSIPGLPCLYLAGSLYACWAEMGRPPFHELHAAAFWVQPGAKISLLNFSDRPARLLLYITPEGEIKGPPDARRLITTHLIIWPLIALSSIIVKHRDAAYKPEYIIPQLLLQWITKEDRFDGICYFSTHVEAVTYPPEPPCNFVFPAQKIKPKGRCARLRSLFKMTTPHSWQLLRAVQAGEGHTGSVIPFFDFEFIDGRKEPYYKTEFGDVESKLNKLAFDIYHRNRSGEPELGDVAE